MNFLCSRITFYLIKLKRELLNNLKILMIALIVCKVDPNDQFLFLVVDFILISLYDIVCRVNERCLVLKCYIS